jgi:hypothetical protein
MRRKKRKNRKIFWIIFSSVFILLIIGGYAAYQYMLNRAAEKISHTITSDKKLMEQIQQQVGDIGNVRKKLQSELGNSNSLSNTDKSNGLTSSENAINNKGQAQGKASSKQQASGKGHHVAFSSKQEAIRFIMSRFSLEEMNRFRQMASDGLTEEEKQELKNIAFSRFTPQEIDAVLKALQ